MTQDFQFFKNLPIAKKVSFSLAMILLPGTLIVTLIAVGIQVYNIKHEAIRDLKSSSRMIEDTLANDVWSFNEKQIHHTLKDLISSQEDVFLTVIVFDSQAKQIAQEKNIKLNSEKLLSQEQIYHFDLIKDDQKVGAVEIKYTLSQVLASIYQIAFYWTITVLFGVMFLVYFIGRSLNITLHQPIENLVSQIRNTKNEDFKSRINQDLQGELSEIAVAFNESMQAIEERDAELARHLGSLEAEIQKRSLEIDKLRVQQLHTSKVNGLSEIGAQLSHEINNPITIISGAVRLVKKSIQGLQLDPDPSGHLDKIQNSVDRITRIVKLMRSVGRDASADPFEKVLLADVFEDVRILTYARLNALAVEFKISIHPYSLDADMRRVQMTQILQVLVENSLEAIKGQKEKWIQIEALEDDGDLIISVTDAGLGIPADVRTKLFTPFFSTKNQGRGSDFGLAQAKKSITDHGGKIWYDSSSQNTRFVLTIPRSRQVIAA